MTVELHLQHKSTGISFSHCLGGHSPPQQWSAASSTFTDADHLHCFRQVIPKGPKALNICTITTLGLRVCPSLVLDLLSTFVQKYFKSENRKLSISRLHNLMYTCPFYLIFFRPCFRGPELRNYRIASVFSKIESSSFIFMKSCVKVTRV